MIKAPIVVKCIQYQKEVYISKNSLLLYLYEVKDICDGKYKFFTRELINQIKGL